MRSYLAPILGLVCLGLTACAGEVPLESGELEVRTPAEACDGDHFPTNLVNPLKCCQDGNRTWHTNNGKVLVYRVYGEPCREADGVGTNCGVGTDPFVQCTYGPCGARNVWRVDAAEVHVFHPDSGRDKCGWSAIGITACTKFEGDECDWAQQGTRDFPEAWDGQDEYGGTITACPYRGCQAGGIPTL